MTTPTEDMQHQHRHSHVETDEIRVITNKDEDDDDDVDTLDQIIEQLGPCARTYWNLDQCLEQTSHSWKLCKSHVQELSRCWKKLEEQGLKQRQQEREMAEKFKLLKLAKRKREMDEEQEANN